MELTEEQKDKIEIYLANFQKNPIVKDRNIEMPYKSFDQLKVNALLKLKRIVTEYLNGDLSLQNFKNESDEISRSFPSLGFKGFNGQMRLNQYVNNIQDKMRDEKFKEALILPKDLEDAKKKINSFADYLRRLKLETNNSRSIPKMNQSFMLSYFWEAQSPGLFPVFYSSTKNVLENIGFDFKDQETPGDEYKYFADICYSIYSFLNEEKGVKEQFPLWFVEHLLWAEFWKPDTEEKSEENKIIKFETKQVVDESWVPPIIGDLKYLALNQETEWSKTRNLKPEKAFETKLRYVFTILGYEVTELGQGKGREPDGVAISKGGHDNYALIYDAKAREKEYSIGTDDREIIEYINKKRRELEKQRINKIYFLIVSSEFLNNTLVEKTLRDIYKKTQVPVVLLRAKDLLYIVERKLSHTDIDHFQMEDLFCEKGILTREKIIDILG